MHTQLEDLFDPALLARMLEDRFVKATPHPTLPLDIYNYTARAQYDNVWNPVTTACRGLIVEHGTGRIIARPFTKFFNLAQHPDGTLPGGEVRVTEKMDGSLGIVYPTPDGHAIATRGSFSSTQALHATAVWRDRYAGTADLCPSWTYLAEIVYPANRIVVDYGAMDDLVLLGAVDTATGASIPLELARAGWPGPVVTEHPYHTVADALAAPQRENREGYVVHFVETDLRVKCKHDTYVRLHRLFTGVSERRVWEALRAGENIEQWLEEVPDELYDFVHTTRANMLAQYDTMLATLRDHDAAIRAELGPVFTRKAYAAAVAALHDTYPLARGLFHLLDCNVPSAMLWDQIRPAEHIPLFQRSLDNE
jgi:RNA ligase